MVSAHNSRASGPGSSPDRGHCVDSVLAQVVGGDVPNKVLYGEAPPRGPTPYHFIYHFGRIGTRFIYLLLKKGSPFTYLFWEVLF